MKNKFTIILVSVIAISSFSLSLKTQNQSKTQVQVDSTRYKLNPNYQLQLRLYDIYKTKQADIVMLGNSLTHGVNWNELLGRSNVVERGIPSDVLDGFLARMSYIYRLKPKICFILGGINDIYNWTPVERIYFNYVRIINGLKKAGIKPVIQSTVYAGKNWGKDWGLTPENNRNRNLEVDKLNNLLLEYARKNNIDYIDLNSKMSTSDHFLRPELTWDGVHFNAEGFKIWGNEVERVLEKYNL
ncbi:GDSL-type esterase/lipase family protein [Melioribacteraceae bacterium 4301-Me]|uniref:GDSL-type esterase/lipase family protein n=1 Tax=Pyranulibacter aquaticus TaxID=3163344 RepID=UPI0035980B76